MLLCSTTATIHILDSITVHLLSKAWQQKCLKLCNVYCKCTVSLQSVSCLLAEDMAGYIKQDVRHPVPRLLQYTPTPHYTTRWQQCSINIIACSLSVRRQLPHARGIYTYCGPYAFVFWLQINIKLTREILIWPGDNLAVYHSSCPGNASRFIGWDFIFIPSNCSFKFTQEERPNNNRRRVPRIISGFPLLPLRQK